MQGFTVQGSETSSRMQGPGAGLKKGQGWRGLRVRKNLGVQGVGVGCRFQGQVSGAEFKGRAQGQVGCRVQDS